ncbi:head GIN domain-containing protein [Fulvivirgaceae bacterium BMA10]|uniref:Head GIN domain-containing protein n=1 Tax=Splendidivirga corallicola TaxID=3051826 RepID=A0ABT8KTA6_9BACT|nr:head GIN domain-containing protein [Fulvivirgaceae bacterium BMA10]
MSNYIKLSLIGLSLILFYSCDIGPQRRGNGNIISRDYDISGFDELKVSGTYEVFLRRGNEEALTIETDENLFDYIDVDVSGHQLEIDNLEMLRSRHGIKVYLTYQEISGIYVGGAANIQSEDVLRSKDLDIKMAGAGITDLEIDARNLYVQISGAGLVKLSGKVEHQDLKLSGAGNLDAFELESNDCEISLSGVGAAQVFVNNSLEASVSGIGGVEYAGDPAHVDKNVSGLGKVYRAKNRDRDTRN